MRAVPSSTSFVPPELPQAPDKDHEPNLLTLQLFYLYHLSTDLIWKVRKYHAEWYAFQQYWAVSFTHQSQNRMAISDPP